MVKANVCLKATLVAVSLAIVVLVVLCTTVWEVRLAVSVIYRDRDCSDQAQVNVYTRQAHHDTAAVRMLQRAVCSAARPSDPPAHDCGRLCRLCHRQ